MGLQAVTWNTKKGSRKRTAQIKEGRPKGRDGHPRKHKLHVIAGIHMLGGCGGNVADAGDFHA